MARQMKDCDHGKGYCRMDTAGFAECNEDDSSEFGTTPSTPTPAHPGPCLVVQAGRGLVDDQGRLVATVHARRMADGTERYETDGGISPTVADALTHEMARRYNEEPRARADLAACVEALRALTKMHARPGQAGTFVYHDYTHAMDTARALLARVKGR